MQVSQDWFIPLRINVEKQKDLFREFTVSWTPTIVILDRERKEHSRFTGFLAPDEFCARIIVDGAKTEVDLKDYDLAITCFNDVIEKYPRTFAVPEAIFYVSVARYLSSHQANHLKQGLEKLRKEFPDSEWTHKAKPYGAIGS